MTQMTAIELLNAAFVADPGAILSLMINRVPCNESLAEDPFIIVEKTPVIENSWRVGALGLINGILNANDLPIVAMKWSEPNEDGVCTLLGFCEYNEPI